MTKQLGQLMYDEYAGIIQAERKVYFNPWNVILFNQF